MQNQQTITRAAQGLDILTGEPRLLTAERLSRNGTPGRLFQQRLPVPNEELFKRLTAQVRKGDTITITMTTEWTGDKHKSSLSDFALPTAQNEPALEAIAARQSLFSRNYSADALNAPRH